MSIQRYSASSPISEVRFHTAAGRTPVALLAARADAATLDPLRRALAAEGWQCIPVTAFGQPQLQVSGFKSTTDITRLLQAHDLLDGNPQITAETIDVEAQDKKSGAKNFFNHFSLQLAGILNLIGDVGFFMSGLKTGDKFKIAGGGLYTLGGLNLTLFGRVKPDHNVREITTQSAEFLKQHTGGLPDDSGLAAVDTQTEKRGLGKYFSEHAAQNTLIAYTAGAGAMLASGIKKYRADPKATAGMYYGISSLGFKAASLAIPEKSKADLDAGKKKSQGGLIGAIRDGINWVREKPLRLFGYGSVITDSMLALDSVQDYRGGKGNPWSVVTASTYILADFMMAISSKDPSNADGKLSADDQRRVEALIAETIARQPKEKQAALVQEVACFLVSQPAIKGKTADIATAIGDQLEQLGRNPWAARVSAVAEMQPAIIR